MTEYVLSNGIDDPCPRNATHLQQCNSPPKPARTSCSLSKATGLAVRAVVSPRFVLGRYRSAGHSVGHDQPELPNATVDVLNASLS